MWFVLQSVFVLLSDYPAKDTRTKIKLSCVLPSWLQSSLPHRIKVCDKRLDLVFTLWYKEKTFFTLSTTIALSRRRYDFVWSDIFKLEQFLLTFCSSLQTSYEINFICFPQQWCYPCFCGSHTTWMSMCRKCARRTGHFCFWTSASTTLSAFRHLSIY